MPLSTTTQTWKNADKTTHPATHIQNQLDPNTAYTLTEITTTLLRTHPETIPKPIRENKHTLPLTARESRPSREGRA